MTHRHGPSLLTRVWHLSTATSLLWLFFTPGLDAQSAGDWNGTRALELVAQARDLRQATAVDSTLHTVLRQPRSVRRPPTGHGRPLNMAQHGHGQ